MKLDVQKLYQQILQGIVGEKRPLIPLNPEEARELFVMLGTSLDQKQWERVKKVLCVLGHTHSYQEIFEGPLCKILNRQDPPHSIKIFALTASTRHVIQRRNQLSQSLPPYYLEAVGSLLTTKSAELKEWVLRTIDEMGYQGKTLAPPVLKNRPRSWHMFNLHHRNSHDIIEWLVKKWGLSEYVK